jgi:putative ABC transport system permease protein
VSGLAQDLRYALRQLRKYPGFTGAATLTLALAIGAASSVFSVVYSELIRPLPFDRPERVFYLESYAPEGYTQPSSYPEYQDWRRENHAFSSLAGFSTFLPGSSNLEGPSGPVALPTVATTDNFFDVFGVKPIIGRTFAPGEDLPGKNDLVVLSYEAWRQDFGANPDAVGQTVKLNGAAYTVIGVMPSGFRFPVSVHNAIYTPLHVPKAWVDGRGSHWLPVVGRLKSGFSAAQAELDMNRVLHDLGEAYPETKGRRMKLIDVASFVVGDTAPALKVLVLAVLAVLAIGSANVAGLVLARGVKRDRELALRSAVGASRARLIRQMLTENVLLGVLAAAVGLVLAYGLLNAIRSLLAAAVARGGEVRMNAPMLLATLTIALITSVLAGLVPSLRLSRITLFLVLKVGGGAGSSGGQKRLRASFIVTQVALAVVLLTVSGLLIRTLHSLQNTDLGFNPGHLVTAKIVLSPEAYRGRDVVSAFYQPLLEKVRAIPGVDDAGVIQMLPIQDWGSNSDVHIVGHPPDPPNEERLAEFRVVTPGYFRALGIRLVRGRMLDENMDTPTAPLAAVVNEAFVRKFFAPDENPIGQHIEHEKATIVGVVQSVRQDLRQPPLAEMDYAMSQLAADRRMEDYILKMHLVVRTRLEPASIFPTLRQVFHQIDPGLPFRDPETMNEVESDVVVFQRLENWLFATFALLAVLLALVGLYALISHEVELSTHDIGIHLALGAAPARVMGGLYRRVGVMLLLGAAIGLSITALTQKLLTSVLNIDIRQDMALIVALVGALILVGLLAVLPPARRAAKIDPMVALRYD